MFSATEDLEEALTLVCATALGLDRKVHGRMRFSDCASLLTSEDGHTAYANMAARFGVVASDVPTRAALAQVFADEALSMRALRLHRGRNVYSAGKLALWNLVWKPLRAALSPDDETLRLARELVAFDTRPGGPDIASCVAWLQHQLGCSGFEVRPIESGDGNPILVARRAACGLRGRVVLYGHYDAAPTDVAAWQSPPFQLTERGGRLYGLAAGDNKLALAVRLRELARMERCPEVVWLLQGDEETGSRAAHRVFPALVAGHDATVWVEENGYHDDDGTQRVLARTLGGTGQADLPPDQALWRLIAVLGSVDRDFGVGHRVESRSLNKDFFESGCPFNRNLPEAARYIAIGVNDPSSAIHRANESVPTWTLPVHARQLHAVMRWVDETARGA